MDKENGNRKKHKWGKQENSYEGEGHKQKRRNEKLGIILEHGGFKKTK
jgi:hypothetical protein